MQEVVLSESACGSWADPPGMAHWDPSPGGHLPHIPLIILCFRRNCLWVYLLRYSAFIFPFGHFLATRALLCLVPTFGFSFLSLGLSLVVFLLALCFSSPASSSGSGWRMLGVSWRFPGDEAEGECARAIPSQDGSFLVVTEHCCPRGKQERFPLAQRPGSRLSGTAKPWVVRVRAASPFPQNSTVFCPLGVHTSPGSCVVPVLPWQSRWREASSAPGLGSCLYLCLPGIAALTPVKPCRHFLSC